MRKISIFALIALMSLSMLSCDINSPRPNTGKVKVILEDIPAGVGAVSIWCAANEWKADNVNGSTQYIKDVTDVKDNEGNVINRTVEFELTDYVLSTPLQFQFTPMPSADTKMGDDWWSYAISGSSQYGNDKNNMTCDFIAKGGYDGCKVTVNKATYGESYWNTAFPVYGISPTRWFNESWKGCFNVE